MIPMKKLMKSAPYKMDKGSLHWMGTYLVAESAGNFKRLQSLAEDDHTARLMSRELKRNARSKDRDILRHPDALREYTRDVRIVTDYATQEERLAGALDLLRDWEKQKQFRPYGTAESLCVGDKVFVAVEGHSLQGRSGVVSAMRAGQYLIEIETRNGTVKAYLNANDLTLISKCKV